MIAFTAAGRDKDRAATRLAGFQSTSAKTSFELFTAKRGLIGIVREVFEDEATNSCFRRLTEKFEKIIVDVQAASPSSWKTDCMAVRMVS
jgi:hypothetical protein